MQYAQWNGPSVTKPNPENCKNCSSKCAYMTVLQYSIQNRTVLIISPLTSRQPQLRRCLSEEREWTKIRWTCCFRRVVAVWTMLVQWQEGRPRSVKIRCHLSPPQVSLPEQMQIEIQNQFVTRRLVQAKKPQLETRETTVTAWEWSAYAVEKFAFKITSKTIHISCSTTAERQVIPDLWRTDRKGGRRQESLANAKVNARQHCVW